MIKLRKTTEGSPTSMVLEPPHTLVGTKTPTNGVRWRHLKYDNSMSAYDIPCITLFFQASVW